MICGRLTRVSQRCCLAAVDIMYSAILELFPTCTDERCCPPGYVSLGVGCARCPEDTYSAVGSISCNVCPANSRSPIASPRPESCICDQGYVGESGGAIETPADSCITCPANHYAYTEHERFHEEFSNEIFNTGVYVVTAGCVPCPPQTHSSGGVESYTAWACECDAGYICSIGDTPCDVYFENLNRTWAETTCINSNNTENPSDVEVRACASSGLLNIRHGPEGDRTKVCFGTNATNATECECDEYAGYQAVNNNGTWYCEDVDECAAEAADTPAPSQSCTGVNCTDNGTDTGIDTGTNMGAGLCTGINERCQNLHGLRDVNGTVAGYKCVCQSGYFPNSAGVCSDIDECSLEVHDCHANAMCLNTNGSFNCNCSRGFQGDGVLDCSDGRQRSCTTVLQLAATTVEEDADTCWASDDGTPISFYCDSDAGTTNSIYVRLFWLELQGWSEEILVAGTGLAPGESTDFYTAELSFVGQPALIQYRVSGADAWHPADLRVRPFGIVNWYTATAAGAPLCWVDANAYDGEDSYVQVGCGDKIGPSYTYDFNECLLETDQCSDDAVCQNLYGGYLCICNAGYFGSGTGPAGSGTECTECPAGSYTTSAGQTECSLCPARTTGPAGSSSSLNCDCAPGYFGAIVNLGDECTICPEASYCPGGATVTSCPDGSWSPSGSESAADCVCMPGHYQSSAGTCTLCPAGTACEGGWQQPVLCLNNTYAAAGSSSCLPCQINSTSVVGSANCVCDIGLIDSSYFGKFSSGTCVSNGCSDVADYESGELCEQAALQLGLTFQAGGGLVAHCRFDGSVIEAGGDGSCTDGSNCVCKDCSPATCEPCPEMQYLDPTGIKCEACPANSVSSAGSSDVTDCSCGPGYFGSITAVDSICSACGLGTYTDTAGQTECTPCEAGSYADSTGSSECTPCPNLATSDEGSDSVDDCLCGEGTIENVGGVGCLNVDECLTDPSPCAGNVSATCTDTVGSFTCTCNPGYSGDGTTCEECVAGYECPGGESTTACPAGAYSPAGQPSCSLCPDNSTSPEGSDDVFDCVCNPGFNDTSGVMAACTNIDECAATLCGEGYNCEDTFGSYICSCPDGVVGTYPDCDSLCGDGIVSPGEPCDDNNTLSGDGCSAICEVENGYICEGSPSICSDLDECTAHNPCSVNATCNNTFLGFTCSCHAGFYGNGLICEQCPPMSTSPNGTLERAGCVCADGRQINENGVCIDVDECVEDSHNCHEDADCSNTEGSFTCACNAGYEDDTSAPSTAVGTQCIDTDECASSVSDCDASATCNNTVGSFVCTCPAGMYDTSSALSTPVAPGTVGSCVDCLNGTYSAVPGATECTQCPGNSSTLVPRASQVSLCLCDAGFYGTIDSASSVCAACGPGFYSTVGSAECTACGGNATSLPRSQSAEACVCPAGSYLDGSSCSQCPEGADSPRNSLNQSFCYCRNGFYRDASNVGQPLVCTECGSCQVGYERIGCESLSQGVCNDVDECTRGTSSCDRMANCTNTAGSFLCACMAGFYGPGTDCDECPINSASPASSLTIENCSCNAGFTAGDGESLVLENAVELCVTTIEIEVVTAGGTASAEVGCLQGYENVSNFCGPAAGTTGDIWLRVGWQDSSWTEWYAFASLQQQSIFGFSEGIFNFSAGSIHTLFLPNIVSVGGPPTSIEYYVASSDSWLPASFAVRLQDGTIPGGAGGDVEGWLRTRGPLCWVAGSSRHITQQGLGCSVVGSSSKATLLGPGGGTSSVEVGILRGLLGGMTGSSSNKGSGVSASPEAWL